MSFLKDNKAQTSIEILLIIGGVIVTVAIIGYFVKTQVVKDYNKGIDQLDNLENLV